MVSHLIIFSIVLIGVTCAPTDDEQFKLIVLHNNDMHARFEQTNSQSGKCSLKLMKQNDCFGGFPRVAHYVNEVKKNEENVIFLNAGDTYQGTVWYTIHKWTIVAEFIQLIGLDAMSLGNHEFDDGVEGLEPFLANISVPVVGANLDFSNEPRLAPYIKPSTVLNVGGKQIGVIGYLTPETRDIANPGKVGFKDEVQTIKAEAKRLTAQGINILIAVGHSGYGMDQRIAREVPEIDLVIGGHTNTFLYTGEDVPSDEAPAGLYPTIVNQKSGRKVPVVSAYAYTKYMGRVELTFDKRGEMTHYQGNPILLDRTRPQDEKVLAALEPWRDSLTEKLKLEMGKTRVYLDGKQSSCRMRECNMGNLITDAFVQYNAWLVSGHQSGWTDAAISILNGGGVRASIDEAANNGTVTMEDVLAVLPFENGVVNLKLQGKYLKEALELSVAYYDKSGLEAPGKYLQVSGLQIEYDLAKPAGKRVVNALVRCADCRVPTFETIDDEMMYGILLTTFVADGGDGYKVIKENAKDRVILDATESDILAEYFMKKSPVAAGLERRTIIRNSSAALHASLGFVLAALLFSKINAWLTPDRDAGWTDAAIGIINGGGIRASIDEKANNGSVSMEDILVVLPFGTSVLKLEVEGKHLKEGLEVSVAEYDATGVEPNGKYLQVSGLQVTYDLARPSGKRVVTAKARCAACRIPTYETIQDDRKYGVLMDTFLADGRDGYEVFAKYGIRTLVLDATAGDVLAEFLKRSSPVLPGLEGRTVLLNNCSLMRPSLLSLLIALLFSKISSM